MLNTVSTVIIIDEVNDIPATDDKILPIYSLPLGRMETAANSGIAEI